MKNILKQAENAERLLKLTSDTMLLLNRDGICMDIAVHNVNLWFMKEEKLLGKNLFQLIPPSTYYQVYPEFKKVLTQKVRSVHNYEMTLGHTTYYFKCIMYPYDGMVLCQYRDITERSQRKLELEKKNHELNEIQKAALIGKHLIESFCRIPVEVEYASEFRYRDPVIDSNDVVIAISQSGETADTLAAVELAKSCGAFIYGICNAVGSSIPRATHTGSYIHVGPEIGVASTKAFTGQVTVLTMLALTLAKEKKTMDEGQYLAIVKELGHIPDKMEEVLKLNDRIAELSKIFTYAHNFIYLGRGYSYPVALEGALKLKEISYIHAEGYPAAEMKHGPIALVDAEMPVVVIATRNGLYEKVLSNIQEIKARKGRVIAIVTKGDTVISKIADTCIELPETMECLDPLITTVPLQLLAYHIAVCKGMDVDQPRNLAKSVTVE